MAKSWLLLCVAFLLCGSIGLHAQYFTIKDYHVDVAITEQGHANFEETIVVEFFQPRHGIQRFIPYKDKIKGKGLTRRTIENIEVDGFNVSTSYQNNNLVIRIGDPDIYVEGRQTYKIRYRVLNPLNHFKEHTEFYWDLLGGKWEANVENFSFHIGFPNHVALSVDDVYVYAGAVGTQSQDHETQVLPNQVRGESTRLLGPGDGLTVAVRLDKDAFPRPSGIMNFLAVHGLLLVAPLFLLAGIIARIYARNRRQTIMTEYFPPEGISPAVAGGFVDHSVDNNDVLSLIPHLANKGYLRMEADEGKGWFSKTRITFYKLKDAGADLTAFEEQFFNALFATGDLVELDDLKNKFYSHLSSIKLSVREWIKLQGWYEADQKNLGCFTGIAAIIAIAWGAYALFARQNLDGIALGAVGLILLYFSSRFNKRSPAGNKTYQKLEGFRQFVAKAERPVIERLLKEDPLYYDHTMPFALAFGYLKQWNKQFEGLLMQPPSWYSSPVLYASDLTRSWSTFSQSFPSEISSIGSVFSSSPGGSSGSGGGFGGGSSGGGSGGGGGGSW